MVLDGEGVRLTRKRKRFTFSLPRDMKQAAIVPGRALMRRQFAPRARRCCVGSAAVAKPGVELGGLLQLLASYPRNGNKAAIQLGQGGHIAPEFSNCDTG